ncbi:MAG: hypothetical protein LQ352_005731, partial [Teloschistes flavicans]
MGEDKYVKTSGYAKNMAAPGVLNRPRLQERENFIQPYRSGAWLESNPPLHVMTAIEQLRDPQTSAQCDIGAFRASSPEEQRKIQDMLRFREPWEPNQPWPESNSHPVASKSPMFKAGLPLFGMGPFLNSDMYDYHINLNRKDGPTFEPGKTTSMLRDVLEADADTHKTHSKTPSKWVVLGVIGQGAYATVYLWRREASNGGPQLRLAVKDSTVHSFWKDYNMEGTLIRKLNEIGCKNVITVLDWLYKPARPPREALVRTCYEWARYGDLGRLYYFYKRNQLILPEAFIWHVFWSIANALCHCRHGTNQSRITRPGWDLIVHGDVKPGNIFLTDRQVNEAYPTVKLGDFGTAYPVIETNPKLRAWKSTYSYGTPYFMAPEVIRDPNNAPQSFDVLVPDDKLHGSHTDVFSLGMVIQDLMSLCWEAVEEVRNLRHNTRVTTLYSADLQNLASACTLESIHARPAIYDIYLRAAKGRERYNRIAAQEKESVIGTEQPSHSDILYTGADLKKFEANPWLKDAYTKANHAPFYTRETKSGPKDIVNAVTEDLKPYT